MTVSPLDIYRIVADPNLATDAKKQQIDMLYGVTAPVNGPDARTADSADAQAINAALADPSLSRPQAPQQFVPGGHMGMSIAPQAAPAPTDLSHLASEDPREAIAAATHDRAAPIPMGDLSPSLQASAGAPRMPVAAAKEGVSHGETAAHGGVVSPESPEDADLVSEGIRALGAGAMRGTPARRVAAHDQPTASIVDKQAPIPEEDKQALAFDAKLEGDIAFRQGEQEAKAGLDQAIGFDNQAHEYRAQAEATKVKERTDAEHMAKLDQSFQQLTKDTAVKPSDWWTSKNAGQKVVSFISAIMFGLAGDPRGIDRAVEADMALREQNREKTLGAKKTEIDNFRAQMMSPEAAHTAERALYAQAVAAEASRLAAAARGPEARLKAQQIAQEYQTRYDQFAMEMAKNEAGTVKTNIAHVPDRVVGGAPDPIAQLERLHKLGLDTPETIRAIMGGQYGAGGADDAKTRVVLPDATVGYTSEDLHKETQNQLDSLSGLQGNMARIKDLSSKTGHTLAGQDKERLKAVVADTTLKLSAMARGEGAQARMAGEMLDRLQPLTGSGALETGTLDATARAGLDEVSRLYDNQIEGIKNRLTPSAKTAPSGGKIKTLGKSKQSLDFEKD